MASTLSHAAAATARGRASALTRANGATCSATARARPPPYIDVAGVLRAGAPTAASLRIAVDTALAGSPYWGDTGSERDAPAQKGGSRGGSLRAPRPACLNAYKRLTPCFPRQGCSPASPPARPLCRIEVRASSVGKCQSKTQCIETVQNRVLSFTSKLTNNN